VPGGYLFTGEGLASTAQVASKIMLLTRNDQARGLRAPDRRHHDLYPTSTAARSKCGDPGRWAARRWTRTRSHRRPLHPESDRIGEEGKGFGYILHS